MSTYSLLLYYPNPVFPYSGSSLSSRQRFDVHDVRTIIFVDWFDGGRTSGGEQWDFDILKSRTELCVMPGGSRGDDRDGDDVPILVDVVSVDRRQRRGDLDGDVDADEDPFGFNMLLVGSYRFISVLFHGTGVVNCAYRFTNLSRDMTSECMRVRRREGGGSKGPPRIFTPPLPPLMMWSLLPRAAW